MFYRLYHIEQLSTNDIAERYKTSNENVRNQLIWFEIARRSEDAGNLKFKHGKHTTWDGKDVYFRSSYELRYAKELDNIKINYFLEGLIFYYIDSNSKYRRIIPDFYLPDTNEIVEIFQNLGFSLVRPENSPEVETEYYNFDMLNLLIRFYKLYLEQ
jgi:adenylate cyclase class IV